MNCFENILNIKVHFFLQKKYLNLIITKIIKQEIKLYIYINELKNDNIHNRIPGNENPKK